MKAIAILSAISALGMFAFCSTCAAGELFAGDNSEGNEIQIIQEDDGDYYWTDNSGKYKILDVDDNHIEFLRNGYRLRYVINSRNEINCLKTDPMRVFDSKREEPDVTSYTNENIEYHAVKCVINHYRKGQIAARDE
ncbi:MAG: hypothetical protein GF307_01545 [candidate division Zixibacteria bacterium]|nr:hypothetical protein [candidate division Zixibacteria bacterium]